MRLAFKTSIVLVMQVLLVLALLGCVSSRPPRDRSKKEDIREKYISVAVEKNINTVVLSSDSLRIMSEDQNNSLISPSRLTLSDGVVKVDGKSYKLPVRIQGSHIITANGKQYHGDLLIHDGTMINVLPLEEYLKGVLSQEVSESWPLEALKAQAIVSRTYALRRIESNKDKEYDIEDTEMHQKFEYSEDNENINKAVTETKGIIILYNKEPIEAFFHACSGGITESAGDVFLRDLPYLHSVPDPYCRDIDRFSWTFEVSAEQIKQSLKDLLSEEYRDLQLKDVKIKNRTGSGRVREFVLRFEKGEPVTVKGNKLRLALDSKQLKSLLIQRIKKKNVDGDLVFMFSGKGYGHGVGMSQWGAKVMAEQGFKYRDILSYYYRRTRLGTMKP